jgi:2-amino-4-hydroxy-6-hydroxymethyldihydropteridine diphosphokinase
MAKIALGLGSNLGNREKNLLDAITLLLQRKALNNLFNISSIINNKAMLLPGSPPEWNIDFLNCVIVGETKLLPHELVNAIKQIEKDIGRTNKEKWAPREIDIDILVYGNLNIAEANLNIPHAALLKRHFAIGLLAEIWPDWQYPVAGENQHKTAYELAQRLDYENT